MEVYILQKTYLYIKKYLYQSKPTFFIIVGIIISLILVQWLYPMIPRTVKPEYYQVGELEIPSFTTVVGYRKITSVTQDLDGAGYILGGDFLYEIGEEPDVDIKTYTDYLIGELGGEFSKEVDDTIVLTLKNNRQINVSVSQLEDSYQVNIIESAVPPIITGTDGQVVSYISREEAKEILLTLTKEETGFKAEIDVYSINTVTEPVKYGDKDYYVFNVVADYGDGRPIEPRGTFYIGCISGDLLMYNEEDNTALFIK